MNSGHRHKPRWLLWAERQGLVSAMNATKWREACEAMRNLTGGPPRYRIKGIDSEGPGAWDREWVYHPHPYELIEWLEIDPEDRFEQVRSILTAVGVPVIAVGKLIRIVGWLRNVSAPDNIAIVFPADHGHDLFSAAED